MRLATATALGECDVMRIEKTAMQGATACSGIHDGMIHRIKTRFAGEPDDAGRKVRRCKVGRLLAPLRGGQKQRVKRPNPIVTIIDS